MSKEIDGDVSGVSIENVKGIRISCLDDDDEEEYEGEEQELVVDEDDDDEEEQESVTLGFLEKPKNRWSLLRQLFPSKAGGVPAWLDPINLPSGRCCVCDVCGEPLQFLFQVYAPVIEKECAFHRTLFVFMCPSMSCLLRDQHEQWKHQPEKASRSVKVFRCQLPRFNSFYSSEPPRYNGTDKPSGIGAILCHWCGTWKGDKACGSCKRARYCSEKHQATHWHSSHKIDCKRMSIASQSSDSSLNNSVATSEEIQKAASNTLWPEYEITNEADSEFDTEMSEDNGIANLLVVSKEQTDDTMKSLLDNFEGDGDKKSWVSFQECIAKAPEQVLRYCRSASAKPLWPLLSGRPSKAEIPKCRYCAGPLCFEFQILPQLLYFFGVKNDVDSLDWASIIVYACEASCEASVVYKEEFAWVQLYTPSVLA